MSRIRLSPSGILSQLQRPQPNKLFLLPPSLRAFSYPKEGVFQPNSPKRDIPGFGPPPPQFQHPNQQPQQQSQHYPQYFPQQGQQQYQQFPNAGQQPSDYQTPRPRYRPKTRNIILGIIAIYMSAVLTSNVLIILEPLEPGTDEDKEELKTLFQELDSFKLVQQLRASTKPDGQRLCREYNAYNGVTSESRRSQRLTTGPLAGSRGVAAQRVFINEDTGVLHLFINFGPSTCGWPGVVHGGIISTICDEALGRCAIRGFEGRSGVTAKLEVSFREKVHPGEWYVLVAGPEEGGEAEANKRKRFVSGHLLCMSQDAPSYLEQSLHLQPASAPKEDTLADSHIHVTCRALFISPKNMPLNRIATDF